MGLSEKQKEEIRAEELYRQEVRKALGEAEHKGSVALNQQKLRLETEKLEIEVKWSKGIRRFLGPGFTLVLSSGVTFLLTYYFAIRPDLEKKKRLEQERDVREISRQIDAAEPGRIRTVVLQLLLRGDLGRRTLEDKIDGLDHNPDLQRRIVQALQETGPVGEDFYVRLLGKFRNNPSWFGGPERLILAYELHTALDEIGSDRARETINQFFEYETERLKEMQQARGAAKGPEGMVYVPPGPFLMGDPPSVEMTEDGYFVDQFEVSNAKYKEVVKGHTFPQGEAKRPVGRLTKAEAEMYCKKGGKGLPSEKQWEKAARGIYGRLYPWGDLFVKAKARTGLDRRDGPVDVDVTQEDRSPYGVYHMSGNVRERTRGLPRGASWVDEPSLARASAQSRVLPQFTSDIIGFRCAQDLKDAPTAGSP